MSDELLLLTRQSEAGGQYRASNNKIIIILFIWWWLYKTTVEKTPHAIIYWTGGCMPAWMANSSLLFLVLQDGGGHGGVLFYGSLLLLRLSIHASSGVFRWRVRRVDMSKFHNKNERGIYVNQIWNQHSEDCIHIRTNIIGLDICRGGAVFWNVGNFEKTKKLLHVYKIYFYKLMHKNVWNTMLCPAPYFYYCPWGKLDTWTKRCETFVYVAFFTTLNQPSTKITWPGLLVHNYKGHYINDSKDSERFE